MNLNNRVSSRFVITIVVLLILTLAALFIAKKEIKIPFLSSLSTTTIKLPGPVYRSTTSVEEAIKQRRSVRKYTEEALNLQQLSQLLWAAQGKTSPTGFRTAPSAGGLYPLEIYVVSGNVQNLPAGVYHYLPVENALEPLALGDKRSELATAARDQKDMKFGAADILITATYDRSKKKYGDKLGQRFVYMESGHAAQNVYLQAVSLNIGTVTIGVFEDAIVKRVLNIPREQDLLYIMPLGRI